MGIILQKSVRHPTQAQRHKHNKYFTTPALHTCPHIHTILTHLGTTNPHGHCHGPGKLSDWSEYHENRLATHFDTDTHKPKQHYTIPASHLPHTRAKHTWALLLLMGTAKVKARSRIGQNITKNQGADTLAQIPHTALPRLTILRALPDALLSAGIFRFIRKIWSKLTLPPTHDKYADIHIFVAVINTLQRAVI